MRRSTGAACAPKSHRGGGVSRARTHTVAHGGAGLKMLYDNDQNSCTYTQAYGNSNIRAEQSNIKFVPLGAGNETAPADSTDGASRAGSFGAGPAALARSARAGDLLLAAYKGGCAAAALPLRCRCALPSSRGSPPRSLAPRCVEEEPPCVCCATLLSVPIVCTCHKQTGGRESVDVVAEPDLAGPSMRDAGTVLGTEGPALS